MELSSGPHATRRLMILSDLMNDPRGESARKVITTSWPTIVGEFNQIEVISLLGEYIVPRLPREFLSRAQPNSEIARFVGPIELAHLRSEAIVRLPVDDVLREAVRLTLTSLDGDKVVLIHCYTDILLHVIVNLPVDDPTASTLRNNLSDAVIQSTNARASVAYLRQAIMDMGRQGVGHEQSRSALQEFVDQIAQRNNLEMFPTTFAGWQAFISRRLADVR